MAAFLGEGFAVFFSFLRIQLLRVLGGGERGVEFSRVWVDCGARNVMCMVRGWWWCIDGDEGEW